MSRRARRSRADGFGDREKLTELAAELGAEARLVELLIAAADRESAPQVSSDLLRQAAAVRVGRLSDPEGAADLYLRVLSAPYEQATQVDVARALSGLLEKIVQPGQRCNVLERLASLETEPEAFRKTALEAARVALEELGDPARAVRDLRPLVDTIPSDREVQNNLLRALRAAENYAELADSLAARAAASEGSDARRDLIELAHISAERLSEPERAIGVWCEVRRRFGPDTESFEALARLFENRGQWQELASLLSEETKASASQPQLFARLGDVHRDHTLDVRAAIDAYIAAGDPEKALRTLESDERLLSKDPLLCVMVAGALKGKGAFAEAESLLRRQLEQKGRRRAKEHGNVHLELAGVLRAAGRENKAFEQLSAAAELYPTDPAILGALGRMTFERGELERAEKIYLALLLLLRHSSNGPGAGLSRAEVYVELGELASRRDESDRARDLMSSALESALESEEERLGLEQALRRRAKFDLLESALETQFARAGNPGASARALAALVGFHRERGSLNDAKMAQMVERADRVRRDLGPRPSDASEFDAFHELVEVYVSLERAEQAIELLDTMSATAGPSDESIRFALEAARLLVEVPFRRDEAATRLQAIWKPDVARADVAILLSRVLEEEGRIEEALAVYQSLPLERGRERETLETIVRLEQARGADPARLTGSLERLLDFEQGAGRAEVARRLSVLYKEQGDSSAMERAIALGFAADPTRAELRDDLVALYAARGAFAQAAATLERALEASSDASLRWRLSEVYQKAGDTDAALRAIDFVPASRPEKAQLGRRRFLVLEAAGRTEEALSELEAAYHIDSRHGTEFLAAIQRTPLGVSSERRVLLAADLFVRYGEPAKAHQTLKGWLETNPTSRQALRRLAKLASKDHDFSTAIDAYRRLARTETGEARKSAALELAKVCDAAGRAGDALADLEAALADAPKDVELCDSVRKLYAVAGARRKQARMVLDQAARTTEASARTALLLDATELFLEERAWGEAFDAAEQARTLDPQSAKAALLSARILVSRGERAKAIETLAKFAAAQNWRKSKDLARVFGEMAEMYLADDELVDALDALSQAHRLDKSDTQVTYLLGLVALDLDQVDVASAALRAFVATRNHVVNSTTADEPTRVSRAYFHLAGIEHARGDDGAARRMVSRAMEESPNNGDARRLMDELRPSSLGN